MFVIHIYIWNRFFRKETLFLAEFPNVNSRIDGSCVFCLTVTISIFKCCGLIGSVEVTKRKGETSKNTPLGTTWRCLYTHHQLQINIIRIVVYDGHTKANGIEWNFLAWQPCKSQRTNREECCARSLYRIGIYSIDMFDKQIFSCIMLLLLLVV